MNFWQFLSEAGFWEWVGVIILLEIIVKGVVEILRSA